MKLWSLLFGLSEVALRMPSVLLSLATGYVVYRLTYALCLRGDEYIKEYAESTGQVAAALFLFNPLIVYYSQEARMYMAVTFFASLLLYSVWPLFSNQPTPLRIRQIVYANCVIALLFCTFYASVFFILSVYLILIFKKKWRELTLLLPGLIGAVLLAAPLLLLQLDHSKLALERLHGWSLVLGRAEFRNLVLVPIKVLSGRYDLNTQTDYFLVGGAVVLFLAIILRSLWKMYTRDDLCIREAGLLGALVLLPVFLGYMVSFFMPQMQYFRFLYIVVPLSVATSILVVKKELRAVLVVLFMLFSCLYVGNPARHREDWRTLAASLPSSSTVYMIPASADPLLYYRPDIRIADISTASSSREPVIFVVPYVFPVYGIDESAILKPRFTLLQVSHFRALTYEVWRRNESR